MGSKDNAKKNHSSVKTILSIKEPIMIFLEYFLYNIKNEILSCSYNTNSSRETFYMYNTQNPTMQ